MKELVTKFRFALDRVDWADMPEGMQGFPKGCCHRISEVLARYLHSYGVENIEYVHSLVPEAKSLETHCWLEVDGVAIDITADQFDGVDEKVLIQSPSVWHSEFKVLLRREPNYNKFREPERSNLDRVYRATVNLIIA